MPNRLSHMKLGFRTSVITLFVSIVLVVGLSLVYLSFARVTSIIRSAAGTFIDKVAESAAGRIDAQFKDVRDCVEVLTSLPSVREARVDNPAINVITAMLRNNNQLFNLYMGYDDGTFLEVDVIDRAAAPFVTNWHRRPMPCTASSSFARPARMASAPPRSCSFLGRLRRSPNVLYRSTTIRASAHGTGTPPTPTPAYSRTPISSSRVANRDTPFVFRSGKDGPA